MKKNTIFREGMIILLALIPVIYLLYMWDVLPQEIPIHWNAKGEIDNYGPKWTYLLLTPGLYLLLSVVRFIDPKKNFDKFEKVYTTMRFVLQLAFGIIACVAIAAAAGIDLPTFKIIALVTFSIIILIGNYFSTLRPNYFIGIRTPWTLESEDNWRKTHRIGGRLWVLAGIFGIVAAFILKGKLLSYLLIPIILMTVVIPLLYSFVLYKSDNQTT